MCEKIISCMAACTVRWSAKCAHASFKPALSSFWKECLAHHCIQLACHCASQLASSHAPVTVPDTSKATRKRPTLSHVPKRNSSMYPPRTPSANYHGLHLHSAVIAIAVIALTGILSSSLLLTLQPGLFYIIFNILYRIIALTGILSSSLLQPGLRAGAIVAIAIVAIATFAILPPVHPPPHTPARPTCWWRT